MPDISYDQLISEFIEARVDADQSNWRQAAIAFFLKGHLGVTGKMIASDTGYSGSHISQLIKTFAAFPEEHQRAMDKSFSLHMVCADTEDPTEWLDRAIAEGWSVRDLKNAISTGKPKKTELEVAQMLWDKIESMLDSGGEGADWLKLRITELQLAQV